MPDLANGNQIPLYPFPPQIKFEGFGSDRVSNDIGAIIQAVLKTEIGYDLWINNATSYPGGITIKVDYTNKSRAVPYVNDTPSGGISVNNYEVYINPNDICARAVFLKGQNSTATSPIPELRYADIYEIVVHEFTHALSDLPDYAGNQANSSVYDGMIKKYNISEISDSPNSNISNEIKRQLFVTEESPERTLYTTLGSNPSSRIRLQKAGNSAAAVRPSI
jgi:hypothetical protein